MKNHTDSAHKYDDLLHLPRPVSRSHPPMPVRDRAAQFAPFAALTGHREALMETERLTTEKASLDENARASLDQKLQQLQLLIEAGTSPVVTITCFQKDAKKEGGSYQKVTGTVTKISRVNRTIVLDDLTIPACDIMDMFW